MSYKKWIHKYKFHLEDLEDVNNLLKKYVKEFNEDFEDNPDEEKIRQQAINKEKIENLKEEQEEQEETIKEDKPGKKLYKQLSKIYHPDRETGDEDKFKSISVLYNNGDTVGLILEALDADIKVEDYIDEEMANSFEQSCINLEKKIEHKKNTIAWHWHHIPNEKKDTFKKHLIKTQPIKERKK
tara:strand:- start:1205 stop:1756 length:552 start_codon:yes stop_codon:yes gene_type:complete